MSRLKFGYKKVNSVWNSSFLFKMVKHRELTENESVHIKALHDAGWSLRQIGKDKVFSQCGQVCFGVSCRDWYLQNVLRNRQETKVN